MEGRDLEKCMWDYVFAHLISAGFSSLDDALARFWTYAIFSGGATTVKGVV